MAKKHILLVGPDARKKIFAGVDLLANAVKLTLGPAGRNFASGVRGGPIHISNDGVSLAKLIQGRDELEDIGVRAVREAATKTNDAAGDGTTGAIVLTQAILEALDLDGDTLGQSPVRMVKRVLREADTVVEQLNAMAKKIETEEELIAVARVSVEDEDLAQLIGGAQWKVGPAGTVLAEEWNEPQDGVEYVYGVRVDNGLGTSALMNNQEKQALELENMPILVTNKVFNTADHIRALAPLIEKLIADGKKGVILMGRAFDPTALALCLSNISKYFEGKGGFPIFPINAPFTDMDEILEDLAAVTGGKYIKTPGRQVESAALGDVGFATQLFTKRYEGVVTGKKRGEDKRVDDLVDARVANITEKLKGTISPFEKRNLEARLAQLTAGTAVIKVGAETEQMRKYKKDKVDDAVNATKAAIQEGVVPGAGQALRDIGETMKESFIGEALKAPYKQIMLNAGGEFPVEEWVQDPVKVIRIGFQKAVSIAASLATTEVLVNVEEDKPMWVQQAKTNMADDDGSED